MAGFITQPLENAIAQANGIDYITSTSTNSLSTIKVNLRLNYDYNRAVTEITSKISSVLNRLPPQSQQPALKVQVGQAISAMCLGFRSNVLKENQITDYLIRVVQPKLQAVPGVQTVNFFGARNFFTGALAGWKESSAPSFYAAAVAADGATLLSAGTDGWLRAGENRLSNASGDDIAGIQADCGNFLLVSAAGDYMAHDSLRLAEMETGSLMQQAVPLEFAGPITALWGAASRDGAIAIAKNLTTGRYEAYAVSLTCR